MKTDKYLTAKDAAERLQIKIATLYAYVSRGLIRSELIEDGSRERRYLREDVEKLVRHRENRRDPAKVAQDALHWGAPVMDSALTLIESGKLYYRGYNVVRLAQERQFEEVAALLWLDDFEQASVLFTSSSNVPLIDRAIRELPMIPALQIVLAQASVADLSAYTLSPQAVARTGVHILRLMTAVIAGDTISTLTLTLAETLAAVWCPAIDKDAAAYLLNAALILCADHELNASSFAARVVAGVDANPYSVVSAGLAALQGYKHGKNTELVGAFIREVGEARYAHSVIAQRLQRGERIPGFGHHLYDDEDPRAAALLALLHENQIVDPTVFMLTTVLIDEISSVIHRAPNIDFALVILELALHLPRGAALMIFALGRTAGWIAHALEQYAGGEIIRPRARYNGRLPVN